MDKLLPFLFPTIINSITEEMREQIFIPKWQRLKQLEKETKVLRSERARACHDLAFAEVISYSIANFEHVEQNENRQQD